MDQKEFKFTGISNRSIANKINRSPNVVNKFFKDEEKYI